MVILIAWTMETMNLTTDLYYIPYMSIYLLHVLFQSYVFHHRCNS